MTARLRLLEVVAFLAGAALAAKVITSAAHARGLW